MPPATTVYAPLAAKLKDDILAGRSTPGQFLGTEIGMAAEAGLSRGSVRTAINELIREELVERRAGKGIYARQPPTGLRVIELVVPSLDDLWAQVAHGAQDAGTERGIKLQIYSANRDYEADLRAIRALPTSGADGAIIGALHRNRMTQSLVRLWQNGFPFVLCDQRLHDIDVPSVVFDNHRAGYIAAHELIRLGHRRIGYVGHSISGLSGSRFDGFRDALNDAGIACDRSLAAIQPVDPDVPPQTPSFEEFLNALPAQHDRPTALVCHNETLALHGCRLLRRLGLRIPDDISIVAIGRDSQTEQFDPPLATVALPFREMGQVALDMLLRRLADPESPIEHRVLPVKWTPRGSVMEAAAAKLENTQGR
ncbi:MAG: LacI family DNA-binding transcriptional regulator [Kiritimatiellae bacterium]|nr:LacI family DNA-binding transcriptional regulator [Kiritimatiellia bacterium]